MLIYAVADIHGRPERVYAVLAAIARHRPDALVLAGDAFAGRRPAALQELLHGLSIPGLAVAGNSDGGLLRQATTRFGNLKPLHLICETVAGVEFVGIDGTVPVPFHTRLGLREAPLEASAARLLHRRSILVVHPPPYGTRDRVLGRFHAGSRAVGRLVDRCSPALLLCGHIHEQAGVAVRKGTIVVNCAMGGRSQGALIRYDGRSTPECRMLKRV
ncbi:MAG TPA: metallophosphoesterase [Desulfosarcina sp.]|nr:metallophosphoesterase [Desulfosarcina sp.]